MSRENNKNIETTGGWTAARDIAHFSSHNGCVEDAHGTALNWVVGARGELTFALAVICAQPGNEDPARFFDEYEPAELLVFAKHVIRDDALNAAFEVARFALEEYERILQLHTNDPQPLLYPLVELEKLLTNATLELKRASKTEFPSTTHVNPWLRPTKEAAGAR